MPTRPYLLDTQHLHFLKFPTFWFDNTPQGKFMLQIAFGQSKYYIDNLSENVKRGLRQKFKRGDWPGWAPLGYMNDKNLRKVVVDPVKGPFVKKLFETYATGQYTVQDLRQISSSWGLMSRSGRPVVKAELFRTLTRPFYYGLMKYKGDILQGTHEPLVTKELFDRVQEVLVRRGKPHKYKKRYFPLLGLALCATCGGAITAEKQKGHHYYRCTKKKGLCSERYTREEILSQQITEALRQVSLPKEAFDFLVLEWAKERKMASQPVARFKETMAQEIPQIQNKLDRLLDTHLAGLISQVEYLAKKEALLNQKIALEAKLSQMQKGATGWLEPAQNFLRAAHQVYLKWGPRSAHDGNTVLDGPPMAPKPPRSELAKPDSSLILSEGENLEDKKDFLKKIGWNFFLSERRLSFEYRSPWRLLLENPSDFQYLGNSGGGSSPLVARFTRAENFQNPDHLEKMRRGGDLNPR